MVKNKTLVFWSSGKDSAYLLHLLLKDPSLEVVGLLTTLRETDKKINIHETEEKDLLWQAQCLDLPLYKVYLPSPCPNSVYVNKIEETLTKIPKLTHLAFGDLFLEDIRKFREAHFKKYELLFPLWGRNTTQLASEIINSGIQARLTAVDENKLPKSFIGRTFDETLIKNLPENVDPCGENGEFHTFVYASPDFK